MGGGLSKYYLRRFVREILVPKLFLNDAIALMGLYQKYQNYITMQVYKMTMEMATELGTM